MSTARCWSNCVAAGACKPSPEATKGWKDSCQEVQMAWYLHCLLASCCWKTFMGSHALDVALYQGWLEDSIWMKPCWMLVLQWTYLIARRKSLWWNSGRTGSSCHGISSMNNCQMWNMPKNSSTNPSWLSRTYSNHWPEPPRTHHEYHDCGIGPYYTAWHISAIKGGEADIPIYDYRYFGNMAFCCKWQQNTRKVGLETTDEEIQCLFLGIDLNVGGIGNLPHL